MLDTINRTAEELQSLLTQAGEPLVPELLYAAAHPDEARARPGMRLVLAENASLLEDLQAIPQLSYTLYRNVQRRTERGPYEQAYWTKRGKLALAALLVLLGDESALGLLHDYLWSTCEETTWVLPQVEQWAIELRAVAAAFDLAEIVVALGDRIEERVQQRVRDEIEQRVLSPYLENPEGFWWYRGHNNWTGVCNGAIGAAFLHLEQDPARLARALSTVLAGLQAFVDTAFEADGTSTEGVGYWRYGLSNLICFSEMLRQRTGGAIDLLASERMRTIARYPFGVALSSGRYFSFSDCDEVTALNPGLLTRLAERTGVHELAALLAEPATLQVRASRFHTLWRDALWWDGVRPDPLQVEDAILPDGGVTRLVSRSPCNTPVVVAAKAGHNGVPHNHNDVGTFVLHAGDETYLCDPERGRYDLYRRDGHDQVVFANSYGHSVPRIGDALQSRGEAFRGEMVAYEPDAIPKRVTMTLGGAYAVEGLESISRTFLLDDEGTLTVEDRVTFAGQPLTVEEAFVTWLKPLVCGRTALLVGNEGVLELTIEAPAEATFQLEVLEKASEENRKPVPLKRLSFTVVPAASTVARVRARLLPG